MMSAALTRWAYGQQLPSSQKFILVTMCYQANPTFFGSLKKLSDMTGLNIKTVRSTVHKLCEAGYLEDSGKRRGKTSQVIEYYIQSRAFSEGLTESESIGEFADDRVPKQVALTH